MNKFKVFSSVGDVICLFILAYLAIFSGIFSILILAISIAYYFPRLIILFIRKKPIRTLLINSTILFLVFGGITVWHNHISETIRLNAKVIVLEVEKYHSQYNEYPSSFKEIGVQELAKKYDIYYINDKEKASLFYQNYWTKFDVYIYSFIHKKWEYSYG